jgi:hypothetical protein
MAVHLFTTTCLVLIDLIKVLELLCERVPIKKPEDSVVRGDMSRLYTVVPTLLIEFDKNSRFDSAGYRLLKYCIRHALDCAAVDTRQAKVDVCCIGTEIALLIYHKVKASMQKDIYNVRVCFTKKQSLHAGATESVDLKNMNVCNAFTSYRSYIRYP